MKVKTSYYQQFDADYSLDVPGEGYGGWKTAELELSDQHTAVVVMHAWDAGTYEQFPGWWKAVEYIPRQNHIVKTVFPGLLAAVRNSKLPLFHVVGGGDYYKQLPGYKKAVELAGPPPAKPDHIRSATQGDEATKALHAFKSKNVFVGPHNEADCNAGFKRLDFPGPARPVGDEGVAENAHQLLALCKHHKINHLIYAGFAINWCLLLSPGGMHEMCNYHGIMCSALRDATTAVENKESARKELNKEFALWRVALAFGFVFDTTDFIPALPAK